MEMGRGVDEESDINDSEINEYKELVYKLLKFRTYKIRSCNGKFRCPFCAGEEEQDYQHNHLLQHATLMSESSTLNAKQRANHFAMVTYLVNDLTDEAEPLPQILMPSPAAEGDDDRSGFKSAKEFENSSKTCGRSRKKWTLRTISGNYMKLLETETRKLQRIARNHTKRVLEEQEMLNLELEKKKQRLDSWSRELSKHEELNKRERLELELEKTNDDSRNNVLQMAEKLRDAEENYQRLVERLKEKEAELFSLKDLFLKECQNNDELKDELQDVRTELIKLLSDMRSHSHVDIGVKKIGEIDEKTFKDACKKRFPPGEAEYMAFALCNLWEEKLKDPQFQPFQIIEDDKGNPQGLLKNDDVALPLLKEKWGEEIYSLVTSALIDLDKYRRSGRYMATVLWNFKENREATLMEVIGYLKFYFISKKNVSKS